MKNVLRVAIITFALLFAAETALAATGTISGTIIPFSIKNSPDSPISDTATATRTFTVETGESAQISWYFNGNKEKTTSNTTTSSLTKSAGEGSHNVKVVASNENGTVTETWAWNVEPKPVRSSSGGGGGGGGGGGIPPLYTDISSPTTVKSTSKFNINVDVDYYWSTEVNISAPEGWEVLREDGTNNFTIRPSEDAEGNYTIWVNTTTPFNTKTERVTVNVESEEQQVSFPSISSQREPVQTPVSTSNPMETQTPTPSPTTQAVESRMVGDIIDRILSGLQAFVGSVFKLFKF